MISFHLILHGYLPTTMLYGILDMTDNNKENLSCREFIF